ncbi:MAG TPA: ThiF family adenylyltransferase, partial [Candidatus Baltobacteraceae bacterium]|nr:ThiF family adenylyltransferase [Candidatus Baltobacteraceae bacterium]
MDDIAERLRKAERPMPWKPEIIDASTDEGRARLSALLEDGSVTVRDDYDEQLREHFALLNPTLVFSPDLETRFAAYRDGLGVPLWRHGRWAYFPWRASLTHVLEKEAYQAVRTSRNRNLITEEEQKRFAGMKVGIAGLSVGNSVALAIVLQGGANRIRLADFDRLALSNINRVRASAAEFGNNKAEVTARQIYELNPYAEVELYVDGLTPENIARFFDGLGLVIDEIDNLAVKCLLRERAKELRLPVVMAADNGDDGVVDIERYDLDAETPFFHGRMGDVSYEKLKGLDKLSTGRLIAKHVGPETVALRMWASLFEIGKTIVSWPQLGGAAVLNGAAVAYCVRAIACGHPLEGNRALISLDEKLIPGYSDPDRREERLR